MSANKEMHEAMSKPENDREFKMHVLKKLDSLEENQTKYKNDLKFFKIKISAFLAILIGAKEAAYKYFII